MPRAARPVNGTSRVVTRKPVSHAKPPANEPDDDLDNDPDDGGADDTPAVRPPVDALQEMMTSLQGASTSRITVYRIVKNQPPSYVFECDPTSFSLDDLRDKYNGGEFRLYVMKDGRLFKNMRVVVEPKQMFHGQEPSAPPASHLSDVVTIMREGFAAQNAALRDLITSRSGPSFANLDLPAVITAAAAAITALRPPPAPVAPPQPDNTDRAMDMFMRGLEIANTMRDSAGEGGGGLSGMLRDVLRSPIVAEAVKSATQQAVRPAPPAQPQLLGPQQAAPQHQPPEVSHAKPTDTSEQEQALLSYYLGVLVGKAKKGADASLYAELVLDNVPDSQLMPLLAMGDGVIDHLVKVHPAVAEHREWFAALLREINDLLEPEAPDDSIVENTGGPNAADSASIVVPGHAAS